jgi:retinol-binding protein 3
MTRLQSLLFLLLFPTFLFAQQPVPLTKKTRAEIVGNVSQLLLDNYVFPDTAIRMSHHILQRLKSGAYDKITDPVAFSDVLTMDLYTVYHDRHLLVQYTPTPQPLVITQPPTIAGDLAYRNREENFGLQQVEILPGNIGYINLTHFWADDVYGRQTVKAALQFVSNTHAVIIDLRNCGGGSQETVAMICGYFLDERTHVNDMYDRPANTTTEYWTTPDSTFTAMASMPLYLLTSNKTFSAAEEFCYDLQILGRATVIGEVTGGGAHGTFSQDAGHEFALAIPYSTAINPITKTSWETVGVQPELEVSSEQALEVAEEQILKQRLRRATSDTEVFLLRWNAGLLQAMNHPVAPDEATLKTYAGVYGERTLTLENGKLYYQRAGRPKFELEATSSVSVLQPKGNTYFRVEFVRNEQGAVDQIVVHYQDQRVEKAERINY